jgi:hypothetical protein
MFALGTGVAAGLLALAIGSPRRQERGAAAGDRLSPQEGTV